MRIINKIASRIAHISYFIGSTCLILGITLSFVHLPVCASTDTESYLNQYLNSQLNGCTLAFDSDASANLSPPPSGDGSPDYCISGIGTGTGESGRVFVENGQMKCYSISHSEYFIDVLLPKTNSTATTINLPASPTPTATDLPTSLTPTDTEVSSSPMSTPMSTSSSEFIAPTAAHPIEGTPATLPPPNSTGTQPVVLIPVRNGCIFSFRTVRKDTTLIGQSRLRIAWDGSALSWIR